MNSLNEANRSQNERETLLVDLPVQEAQPSFINTRGAALNYVLANVHNGESAHCSDRDN